MVTNFLSSHELPSLEYMLNLLFCLVNKILLIGNLTRKDFILLNPFMMLLISGGCACISAFYVENICST
jgi:hypothetical protein